MYTSTYLRGGARQMQAYSAELDTSNLVILLALNLHFKKNHGEKTQIYPLNNF